MKASTIMFCILLSVLILLVSHFFFGNCQTTKYHYFLQTKYLKRDAGYPDKFVGRWKVWDDELRLFLEFEIKNNQYNGLFKEYYTNGSIKEKSNYVNNKLHGEKVLFYENGALKQKQNFLAGERNGKCIDWFPNGELKQIFNYKNDEWVGQVIVFHDNGLVSGVLNREDMSTTGDYVRFHKNGKIESRIDYDENEKIWYRYEYDENGEFLKKKPSVRFNEIKREWEKIEEN